MDELTGWDSMRAAAPFAPEAFRFVQEGLGHTLAQLRDGSEGGQAAAPDGGGNAASELLGELFSVEQLSLDEDGAEAVGRHVSGQELCLGLRSLAVEKYGLLARTVLRGWGVGSTEDFGRIVYAMVEAGLLRTSERDSLDDFRGVYDFDEAFDGPADRLADCSGGGGTVGKGELG
ncbi:MAG: hypothetical protein RIB58_10945 [Phycisphaerales bacterium]|jgi:uncharacterized repeat protein (TIGR04138 family)